MFCAGSAQQIKSGGITKMYLAPIAPYQTDLLRVRFQSGKRRVHNAQQATNDLPYTTETDNQDVVVITRWHVVIRFFVILDAPCKSFGD